MKADFLKLFLFSPFFFVSLIGFAEENSDKTLQSFFRWNPQSIAQEQTNIPEKGTFLLRQGNIEIQGSQYLKAEGEELMRFLSKAQNDYLTLYGLTPGDVNFLIPIFSLTSEGEGTPLVRSYSDIKEQLVFPFPLKEKEDQREGPSGFLLLQTMLSASLAFGNNERLPISSHAFQFIDGFSGFLALQAITKLNKNESEPLLQWLTDRDHKQQKERRFFSDATSKSKERKGDSSLFGGLGALFSGISIDTEKESEESLQKRWTTADGIRVFQWILSEFGEDGIQKIVASLSKKSGLWWINKSKNIDLIDETRADIILKRITGFQFEELLHLAEEIKPLDSKTPVSLPNTGYAEYAFKFPKEGGANEGLIIVTARAQTITLQAGDIAENQVINMTGGGLQFGYRDEANAMNFHLRYLKGGITKDEEIDESGTSYSIKKTMLRRDLLIGSKIIQNGGHTKWPYVLGVYFHWISLDTEWDTSDLAARKTDLEYINRSFFFLDIQNYSAIKFDGFFDLGLNYNFQIGGVNQSGSISIVRNEKYNKDYSSFALGLNFGPEIRIILPSLNTSLKIGAVENLNRQLFDEQGGIKDGGTLNASESSSILYASLGFKF